MLAVILPEPPRYELTLLDPEELPLGILISEILKL